MPCHCQTETNFIAVQQLTSRRLPFLLLRSLWRSCELQPNVRKLQPKQRSAWQWHKDNGHMCANSNCHTSTKSRTTPALQSSPSCPCWSLSFLFHCTRQVPPSPDSRSSVRLSAPVVWSACTQRFLRHLHERYLTERQTHRRVKPNYYLIQIVTESRVLTRLIC